MASEVPTKRTPLDVNAVAAALVVAFARAGHPLTRESAPLFLALVWLETGRGLSCYNWNVGNLTPGKGYADQIRRPAWYRQETIDAEEDVQRRARLQDLHDRMGVDVPSAFRAYDSLEEGVQGFAEFFSVENADRYRRLLEVADQGDAKAFADEIRASGYTPNLAPEVATTLEQLRAEFAGEGRFSSLPSQAPPVLQVTPTANGISVFVPFGLIAAAFFAWSKGRSGR